MSVSNNVSNSIPFLDLVTPHVELEQELTEVFHKALRTAGFIGGPMVEEFEKAFATFCDTSHSVAVSSGTDALRFALMASGVKPGDVVVTVPHTFIATTEAISQAGALPEFVDIDARTYNMDPAKLAEYLEKHCYCRRCRQASDPSQPPPRHGRGSSPSLRADGRYGRHPGTGGALPPGCDRRCLPGPWRRVFLEETQSLDEGWFHGPSLGLQLLPRQESGGMR